MDGLMEGLRQQLKAYRGAIDAQGQTVQRSRKIMNSALIPSVLVMGCLFVSVPQAQGAFPGQAMGAENTPRRLAGVAGVVRDTQGTAQMGALVQVLTSNARTVATAFTDQHGRYFIANLVPGKYLVRASATLFVPGTRTNLQLRTGATAVVNLTLAALYDTASWLPAQRRRADEASDDWKWTLRSTANRPILRIVEEGTTLEVSSSAHEGFSAVRARAQEAFESGDGGFGQGGLHNVITIHEGLDDGSDVMLRADLGTGSRGTSSPSATGTAPSSSQEGMELDAGYEGRTRANDGAFRSVLSYKSHPGLVGDGIAPGMQGYSGLQVMELTTAERMAVGDRIQLEGGNRLEAIHEGASRLSSHPFFRVVAHPSGSWTLEYRMAADRGVQEFDDVTSGSSDVPVALMRNGHLALEQALHQEIAAGRRATKASVRLAFYHDAIGQAAIAGGEAGIFVPNLSAGTPSAYERTPGSSPTGILLDPTTGSFRTLAGAYKSEGARLSVSSAITPSLWVAGEYSTGEALSTTTSGVGGAPVGITQALAELHVTHSQTATLALKGKLLGAGTRVRASYRWQPTRNVTAVDSYSAFADQAYFSCMLRQPLRLGRSLPQGLEATIDVTNLMAQGYRPFLSADGQTLYFAQAPRTIQAGLSFSF